MTDEHVRLTIGGSLATVELSGRGELNLLHQPLFERLDQVLEELNNREDVRVVVLKGRGDRAFSGGVDVKMMKEFDPTRAEAFIRSLHAAMIRVLRLKQPVIAQIMGPCLGGAMELVMACDLRVASPDARFGLPEIRVGVPSVIEAALLQHIIGLSRARELILLGDLIDAQEALAMGFLNKVAARADLEAATRSLAERFLELSPKMLAVQKEIVYQWLNLGLDQGAEYSSKAFGLCFATDHPREAMTAFLEKRKPRF